MCSMWINKIISGGISILSTAPTFAAYQSGVVVKALLPIQQTRLASKVAGGATKNRKRSRKIPRGFKVEEGQEVQRGTILCTQLQLRYYPGENVIAGSNMTLNSMVDGNVLITKETLNPYPDSPIYPGVVSGDIIERLFLHVMPHEQQNKFRLVSLT